MIPESDLSLLRVISVSVVLFFGTSCMLTWDQLHLCVYSITDSKPFYSHTLINRCCHFVLCYLAIFTVSRHCKYLQVFFSLLSRVHAVIISGWPPRPLTEMSLFCKHWSYADDFTLNTLIMLLFFLFFFINELFCHYQPLRCCLLMSYVFRYRWQPNPWSWPEGF